MVDRPYGNIVSQMQQILNMLLEEINIASSRGADNVEGNISWRKQWLTIWEPVNAMQSVHTHVKNMLVSLYID